MIIVATHNADNVPNYNRRVVIFRNKRYDPLSSEGPNIRVIIK